jgi:hypothetical protein
MSKYKSFWDAPDDVRNRYITMKYGRYGKDIGLMIGRRYTRIKLTIEEFRKNRVLDATLGTMIREVERAENREHECVKVLLNMALFYLIAEKDIQTLKIDALTHPNKWKRNLALRTILLTIYEWDMGKFSDKNLNDLLDKSGVSIELKKEFFVSLRVLRKAQKKSAKILHVDRNSIIAHRDADALLQIRSINNLSEKTVFEAAGEFYAASKGLMIVLPKVLLEAGSMQGLLSEMLNYSNA